MHGVVVRESDLQPIGRRFESGHSASRTTLGKLFTHTHVPLSPSSINWYRHWLWAQWPGKGRWAPRLRSTAVLRHLYLLPFIRMFADKSLTLIPDKHASFLAGFRTTRTASAHHLFTEVLNLCLELFKLCTPPKTRKTHRPPPSICICPLHAEHGCQSQLSL